MVVESCFALKGGSPYSKPGGQAAMPGNFRGRSGHQGSGVPPAYNSSGSYAKIETWTESELLQVKVTYGFSLHRMLLAIRGIFTYDV